MGQNSFFSSAVIEDDTAELFILLIVRRRLSVRPSFVRPSTITFSSSSPEPQLRMVSNLICNYLEWFSLRFVHFVSITWILYFWWIFWVIFGQNWYFQLLLQNRNSEWFQIWYASTYLCSFIDNETAELFRPWGRLFYFCLVPLLYVNCQSLWCTLYWLNSIMVY